MTRDVNVSIMQQNENVALHMQTQMDSIILHVRTKKTKHVGNVC